MRPGSPTGHRGFSTIDLRFLQLGGQVTPIGAMTTCTARVLAGSAGRITSVGSGFLYGFPPATAEAAAAGLQIVLLVTNKHVLDGCDQAEIVLTIAPKGAALDSFERPHGQVHQAFALPLNGGFRIDHPSPEVDLCGVVMGPLLNQILSTGNEAHHFIMTKSMRLDAGARDLMRTVEPIAMVGYPNGLWDEANNAPITRRGITATHPLLKYRGRNEFLIDAACFPGSSGSPVFVYESGMYRSGPNSMSPGERVALIGILWGGPQFTAEGTVVAKPIPHNATGAATTNIPMNLGFVLSADELDAIGEEIVRRGLT